MSKKEIQNPEEIAYNLFVNKTNMKTTPVLVQMQGKMREHIPCIFRSQKTLQKAEKIAKSLISADLKSWLTTIVQFL